MTKVFELLGVLRLQGASEFNKQLKQTETQSKNATERMSSNFERLGKAVITAFSINAIKNFASSLVSAAAQVNASNAQFEATFKEVGSSATKMFNDVSKATGVMATRLRVAGTKAFSQFKGAGLDANNALSETERYLNLAADAAAYYDISLEDADTRLRSFIRGNVEAGDMIGLFTSESQRNTKALELYGKKYIELTEAQKQMTMLNIADEIYRQSGALGQASRESGEYANQTGNLAESWLQLKAVMGDKILEAVIPIMQSLASWMDKLTDKVKEFNKWIDENRETVSKYIDIAKSLMSALGGVVVAFTALSIIRNATSWVSKLITVFTALIPLMAAHPILAVATAFTAVAGAIAGLYASSSDFRKFWITLWDDIRWEINNFIDKYRPQIDTIIEGFNEVKNAVSPVIDKLINDIVGLSVPFQNMIDDIWTAIQAFADWFMTEIYPVIEPFLGDVWDVIKIGASELFDFIKLRLEFAPKFIENIFNTIGGLSSAFTKVLSGDFSGAWEDIKGIFNGWKDFFSDLWDSIKDIFGNIGEKLSEKFGDSFKSGINTALVWVEDKINAVVDFINSINRKIADILPGGKTAETASQIPRLELPRLADGGTVTQPTIAEIGEDGKEAIIPLEKSGVIDEFAKRISVQISSGSVGVGSYGGLNNKSLVHDELYDVDNVLNDISSKIRDINEGEENWRTSAEGITSYGELIDSQYQAQIQKLQLLNREYDIAVEEGGEMGTNAIETKAQIDDLIESIKGTQRSMGEVVRASEGYKNAIESGAKSAKKTWNESLTELRKKFTDWVDSTKNQFTELMGGLGEVFDNIVEGFNTYVTPLFTALQDLRNQQLQNEIDALEAQYEQIQELNEEKYDAEEERLDEQNDLLKDKLYEGEISYKQYNDAVKANEKNLANYQKQLADQEQKAEEEIAKKKDELGKKQFEANKSSELANVWINAASGIMKAYAQSGWILGSVQAALITAAAGVQTAAINKQQYVPALAEGGVVDEPTHALIGEDGREAVVPLENNTEWVGGLAKAIAPAVANVQSSPAKNDNSIRKEINEFRQMVAEFFDYLRGGNAEIVIDGQTVARVISPYVNTQFGNAGKLRARGV